VCHHSCPGGFSRIPPAGLPHLVQTKQTMEVMSFRERKYNYESMDDQNNFKNYIILKPFHTPLILLTCIPKNYIDIILLSPLLH
jgi:hypothetical protein